MNRNALRLRLIVVTLVLALLCESGVIGLAQDDITGGAVLAFRRITRSKGISRAMITKRQGRPNGHRQNPPIQDQTARNRDGRNKPPILLTEANQPATNF